jgi:ubiquinone/menaquinone biosynthesis C-methylase UbiE
MEGNVSETGEYMQKLLVMNPLMEPIYREAIRALELPKGSQGLDAGCGIGLQMPLLADAVGPKGHITGLDISPEFIAHAEGIAKKSGLSEQISFKVGDVYDLPFDEDTFDWLWSSCCVGYPSSEPEPLLRELSRVIRPGGKVAILIYSSQLLLPGYPVLEARLNATSAGIAPFTCEMKPQNHFTRILSWFRDAAFEESTVKTLVGDVFSPLSPDIREAVSSLISMRWPGADEELSPEDRDLFQRLTHPESPACILNLQDYYAFFTLSLFQAKVRR